MEKKAFAKALRGFVARLTSRKFLLAIIGAAVAFGNYYWEWGLEKEEIWTILIPILTFIGIEGGSDIVSRIKE